METIEKLIADMGPELMAMIGSINAKAGVAVAMFVILTTGYFGLRAKIRKPKIGKDSSKDQKTSDSVQDDLDNFLNGD